MPGHKGNMLSLDSCCAIQLQGHTEAQAAQRGHLKAFQLTVPAEVPDGQACAGEAFE